MTTLPSGWHPDPSRRHELRFWDGLRWTEHVSSGGRPGVDPLPSSSTGGDIDPTKDKARRLGWTGLALVIVALIVVSVPAIDYRQERSGPSFAIGETPRKFSLPPDKTYGIFVDDPDDGGYSTSCSVKDDQGRTIPSPVSAPSQFTFSSTLYLKSTFETGSGTVTVGCTPPSKDVSVRPAPSQLPLLVGGVAGASSAVVAVALLIAWLVVRRQGPRRPS
jgi:hypothetical protein